jgi:formylglycine-generating enzyme required for sulfatase activity
MMSQSESEYFVAILNDPANQQHRHDLADLLAAAKDPRGEIVRSLDRLVAWGADTPDERPQIEKRLCELLESGVSAIGPFVTNSIAMKLALIVPGEFVMGSPDNEFGHREDEAQDVV